LRSCEPHALLVLTPEPGGDDGEKIRLLSVVGMQSFGA